MHFRCPFFLQAQAHPSRMASNFKRAHHMAAAPATHNHIKFDDDFDSVHSREARIDQHGHGIATQPKLMHGIAGWTLGSTWSLEEDHEMALDADGQAYNDEMNVKSLRAAFSEGSLPMLKNPRDGPKFP